MGDLINPQPENRDFLNGVNLGESLNVYQLGTVIRTTDNSTYRVSTDGSWRREEERRD